MKYFVFFCASVLLSSMSVAVLSSPSLPSSSSAFPTKASSVSVADASCMPGLKIASQYYWGRDGTKKDRVTARRMLEKLAKRGCSVAQSTLGTMYELGQGGAEDLFLAVYWIQRAADQNNPTALRKLGSIYLQGRSVEKNPEKARLLFERAALKGDLDAQFFTGVLYYEPKKEYLLKRDVEKGLYWLGTAATQGHLGAKYFLEGIKKSEFVKKHGALPRSTENTRPLPCSENPIWQEKIVRSFFLKDGRNSDLTLIASGPNPQGALKLLEEVASEGCTEAQILVGNSYYYGFFGDIVDKKKSIFWLKKAAQQGSIEARRHLD